MTHNNDDARRLSMKPMTCRVRLALVSSLMMTMIALAGCSVGRYSSAMPDPGRDDVASLYVIPHLTQSRPYAMSAQGGPMMFGPVIIEAPVRADSTERFISSRIYRMPDLDLEAALLRAVALDPQDSRWRVAETSDVVSEFSFNDLVTKALQPRRNDAVVVYSADIRFSICGGQMIVALFQQTFPREELARSGSVTRPSHRRLFVYQSPVQRVPQTPLTDELRLLNALRIANVHYPDPVDAADMDDRVFLGEISVVEDRDTVYLPTYMTMDIAWTDQRLRATLAEAVEHLNFMINFDWNDFERQAGPQQEKFKAIMVAWTGLEAGIRKRLSGERITTRDDNAIYRARNGAFYSVPLDTTTEKDGMGDWIAGKMCDYIP